MVVNSNNFICNILKTSLVVTNGIRGKFTLMHSIVKSVSLICILNT